MQLGFLMPLNTVFLWLFVLRCSIWHAALFNRDSLGSFFRMPTWMLPEDEQTPARPRQQTRPPK
jgi:hypothetical protein